MMVMPDGAPSELFVAAPPKRHRPKPLRLPQAPL